MRSADNLNCQAPRMSLEPVFSCARVPCHRAPMAFAPVSVARRPPSPHSICAPEISTGKFRPVIHKRVPFKSVEPAIAAVQGKKPSCQRRCNSAEPSSFHRSEEHTSELQSQSNLVCRLLLEKKKKIYELLKSLPDVPTDSMVFRVLQQMRSMIHKKMSSLMPCPMRRSVIFAPGHMMYTQRAV